MISEDFAFFGFDDTSWDRLVSLFLGEGGEDRPRGVLVVVVDAERTPVASFHTATGSLDPATLPDSPDLEALCDATGDFGSVVSIANGWLRYLPHERHFRQPQANLQYEILNSTFVPQAAEALVAAGLELRGELA